MASHWSLGMAASSPSTASSGVACRVVEVHGSKGPGLAIGSQQRTVAPSASSGAATTVLGASRMSSVLGLNVNAEQRDGTTAQAAQLVLQALDVAPRLEFIDRSGPELEGGSRSELITGVTFFPPS